MKIATWNVNSIRARQDRLLGWLEAARPDVLCLQEIKCVDEKFPLAALESAGYHAVCHGQKTYNGVAILSKIPPEDVLCGIADGGESEQARVIAASFPTSMGPLRVICVYAPNGQAVDSPAYQYKLEWYGRMRRYLETRHRPDEALVICGDFNVAPEPEDVWDPAVWEGQTLFTLPERAALRELCGFGLRDVFRKHHPEPGRYSFWDYRMLAFPKNQGLRIDHLFATGLIAERCTASEIDRDARKGKLPSDHAPVWMEVDA